MKKYSTSVIVGIICVAITIFATFSVLNTSFLKIPIFEMVLGEDDMDDAKDSLDDYVDRLEDITDEEAEEFEDEVGIKYKNVIKMFKNPSVNNMIKLGEKLEDYDGFGIDEIGEEVVDVLSVVRTVVYVCGAIIALLSLAGALMKKKGFTVFALIVSIPFYIFIVGWFMFILFIIASIAHIVLVSREKKAAAPATVVTNF